MSRIKGKKNIMKKKNLVLNLKWATAHLSRRLGAGLGARARGAQVGTRGAAERAGRD